MKRKHAKQIHPLADDERPCGKVRFIHSDGKEHAFHCCVNIMTGSQMSWMDCDPPTINDPEVRTVFKNIHKKAKIIEHIGDFKP